MTHTACDDEGNSWHAAARQSRHLLAGNVREEELPHVPCNAAQVDEIAGLLLCADGSASTVPLPAWRRLRALY